MLVAAAVRARWYLLAAGVGLAATLVPRHPAPAPEPEIICVIPDVMLRQAPPPQLDHRVVTARWRSRGAQMPACGTLEVDTAMVFTEDFADGAALDVRVPCAELTRAQYSRTAGNAPVLHGQSSESYRLELTSIGHGAWRADRIDVVPIIHPLYRPAIADRMCYDVWSPSCPPRR
jgi:hypothetical protein